jgi:hypothetical protein
MRDLRTRVSSGIPQPSATPEPRDPGRRAAYEYCEKHGFYANDASLRKVFSNRRGINRLQRIAQIFAVCGITGLTVWTITAVLNPVVRGYDGTAYNQTEVDKPAKALPSLRAVRALKLDQIVHSDPSTR